MIAITDHADGCVLPVRAQPGARKNAVTGEHAGALKVAVTAPPEDGRANDAVVRLVSDALGVPAELVSGFTSRDKVVAVDGVTAADIERLLSDAAGKERT